MSLYKILNLSGTEQSKNEKTEDDNKKNGEENMQGWPLPSDQMLELKGISLQFKNVSSSKSTCVARMTSELWRGEKEKFLDKVQTSNNDKFSHINPKYKRWHSIWWCEKSYNSIITLKYLLKKKA